MPIYWHIMAKIPVISKIAAKMNVSVSVADMLLLIYLYWQKYWLGEYIDISISW